MFVTAADVAHLALIGMARLGAAGLGSAAVHARALRTLGDLGHRVRRERRRRIAARLAAVLGAGTPPAEIARLTREVFRQGWLDNEAFCLHALAHSAAWRRAACARLRVEGLDALQAALARGRGAILWECTLGQRVLAKVALIDRGFPLCQVHGPAHGGSPTWMGRHVLRPLQRRAAARLFVEIVDIQEESVAYLRRVTARLRGNGIVCIPALGYAGQRFASLPFLGAPARMATGVVTLARTTGAALIPIFCFVDRGAPRLVLGGPLDPTGDGGLSAAAEYAGRLEALVRAHPEQWPGWL
jgi:KDO2-lipid IV(A) lauroyltransferase